MVDLVDLEAISEIFRSPSGDHILEFTFMVAVTSEAIEVHHVHHLEVNPFWQGSYAGGPVSD